MCLSLILGLRGAICYVLSLHLELDTEEKRHVVITTALIIVLFTILVLGGATLPVVKVRDFSLLEGKKLLMQYCFKVVLRNR